MKLINLLLRVLLVILLSEGVSLAPLVEVGEGLGEGSCDFDVAGGTHDDKQDEINKFLEDRLLNNTENVDKIKTMFNLEPGVVRICVYISFYVYCTAQVSTINCMSIDSPLTAVWTSFDTTTLAGGFLYLYGLFGVDIFGFEWAGACDVHKNALPLYIDAGSLSILNDVDDGENFVQNSILYLTKKVSMIEYLVFLSIVDRQLHLILLQLPYFSNNGSENIQSFSTLMDADELGDTVYANNVIIVLAIKLSTSICLPMIALATIYGVARDKIEYTKSGRKPKAFFQFWAVHLFLFCFSVLTTHTNIHTLMQDSIFKVIMVVSGMVTFMGITYSYISIFRYRLIAIDLNTPFLCPLFCLPTKACCHHVFLIISIATLVPTLTLFIFLFPNIVFVYYLYPTRTLIRLPLLINSILYINSLIACLIFQCEKLCFLCSHKSLKTNQQSHIISVDTNNNKLNAFYRLNSLLNVRMKKHMSFYATCTKGTDDPNINTLPSVLRVFDPIATFMILVVLIIFIKVICDLINLHHYNNQDNHLELLLTLVPTLLLLFGSWYKLDVFFVDDDIDEEPTNLNEKLLTDTKELLTEVRDELHSVRTSLNDHSSDVSNSAPASQGGNGVQHHTQPSMDARRQLELQSVAKSQDSFSHNTSSAAKYGTLTSIQQPNGVFKTSQQRSQARGSVQMKHEETPLLIPQNNIN